MCNLLQIQIKNMGLVNSNVGRCVHSTDYHSSLESLEQMVGQMTLWLVQDRRGNTEALYNGFSFPTTPLLLIFLSAVFCPAHANM